MKSIPARTVPKIERGKSAPLPRTSYPFSEMAVGDYFKIAPEQRPGASSAACKFGKAQKPAWMFSVRKDGDVIRVWRVK